MYFNIAIPVPVLSSTGIAILQYNHGMDRHNGQIAHTLHFYLLFVSSVSRHQGLLCNSTGMKGTFIRQAGRAVVSSMTSWLIPSKVGHFSSNFVRIGLFMTLIDLIPAINCQLMVHNISKTWTMKLGIDNIAIPAS